LLAPIIAVGVASALMMLSPLMSISIAAAVVVGVDYLPLPSSLSYFATIALSLIFLALELMPLGGELVDLVVVVGGISHGRVVFICCCCCCWGCGRCEW